MPALQVAARDTYQSYVLFRDEVYKWAGHPDWQSYRRMNASLRKAKGADDDPNPLLSRSPCWSPALNAGRLAAVRVDRQLDALQCIEAIRLHAADHDGALPPNLEAIQEAPVPLDPASGKSFEIHRRRHGRDPDRHPSLPGPRNTLPT